MTTLKEMTSIVPHMFTAILQWLEENNARPHVLLSVREGDHDSSITPYLKKQPDGMLSVSFNLCSTAIKNLNVTVDKVSFNARFSGVATQIQFRLKDVEIVYSPDTPNVFIPLTNIWTLHQGPSVKLTPNTAPIKKEPSVNVEGNVIKANFGANKPEGN